MYIIVSQRFHPTSSHVSNVQNLGILLAMMSCEDGVVYVFTGEQGAKGVADYSGPLGATEILELNNSMLILII